MKLSSNHISTVQVQNLPIPDDKHDLPSEATPNTNTDPFYTIRIANHNAGTEPYIKQANIVLIAMEQVIYEQLLADSNTDNNNIQKPTITNTMYFGTIMSALHRHPTGDTLLSLILLLSIILQSVHQSIITNKFNDIAELLLHSIQMLQSNNNKQSDIELQIQHKTIKYILQCSSTLLQSIDYMTQTNASLSLNHSYTQLIYIVVQHITHTNAKVRKQCISILCTLFNTITANNTQKLYKFIDHMILQYGQSIIERSTKLDHSNVLYLCGCLQQTIQYYSIGHLTQLLQYLFNYVLIHKDTILLIQVYKTLIVLYEAYELQVDDMNDIKKHKLLQLSDKLCSIIPLLLPSTNQVDYNLFSIYCYTMTACTQFYQQLNTLQLVNVVYQYCTALTEYIQLHTSAKHSIIQKSYDTIQRLLMLIPHDLSMIDHKTSTNIVTLFSDTMSYRYSSNYKYIFQCIAVLILYYRPVGALQLYHNIFVQIDSFINNSDIYSLHSTELKQCVHAILLQYNITDILNILPLNLPDESDQFLLTSNQSRLYLIDNLDKTLMCQDINQYNDVFVPYITHLNNLMRFAEPSDKLLIDRIIIQLYHGLIGLCNYSIHIENNTELLIQLYTQYINEYLQQPDQTEVVSIVLLSLNKLIQSYIHIIESTTEYTVDDSTTNTTTQSNISQISTFSDIWRSKQSKPKQTAYINKRNDIIQLYHNTDTAGQSLESIQPCIQHILPLLIQLCLTQNNQKIPILYDTIKLCFSEYMCSQQIQNEYYEELYTQLQSCDNSNTNNDTDDLLDLMCVLVPHLYHTNIDQLYTTIESKLMINSTQQKKYYTLLYHIVQSQPDWFNTHVDQVMKSLHASTTQLSYSSTKTRLQCIDSIIHNTQQVDIDYMNEYLVLFIGEILLGLKERNSTSRAMSYSTIIQLGYRLLQSQSESTTTDTNHTLHSYVQLVMAGLSGDTAHMQSCSVLALARIVYEFHQQIHTDTIELLLSTVLHMFQLKNREVITSLIGFIKVVVLILPVDILQQYMESLIHGMCRWCNDSKNKFKLKIRIVFSILLRRTSIHDVIRYVTTQHKPLIQHINKQQQKEARHKQEKRNQNKHNNNDPVDTDDVQLTNPDNFDAILNDSEVDDHDDNDTVSMKSSKTNKTHDSNTTNKSLPNHTRHNKSINNNHSDTTNQQYIHDTDQLDFTDEHSLQQHLTNQQQYTHAVTGLNGNKKKRKLAGEDGITQTPDGKLMINDQHNNNTITDNNDVVYDSDSSDARIDINKLSRKDKKQQYQQKLYSQRISQMTGAAYKSRHAGGDIQLKGQRQPYAYIPLDVKSLNKRTRHQSQRQLNDVLTHNTRVKHNTGYIKKRKHK